MTSEVMLFTFPWQTSVSNLYLLCLSLPHHLFFFFFFPQPSFSPFRHAQLHNSRQGATSDQTKEETKMRRFFFFQRGNKYLKQGKGTFLCVLNFILSFFGHSKRENSFPSNKSIANMVFPSSLPSSVGLH